MSLILKSFLIVSFGILSFTAHSENLRISPENLNATLNAKSYVILDARETSAYNEEHIQGALNFPTKWTFENQKTDGKVIAPDRIQVILRDLGINIDTPVVIYDQGKLIHATRLFWTLEVYGLKNVKVMSSGYDYWTSKNFPTSTEKTAKPAPSNYIPVLNNKRLATKFAMQIATRNPNQIIVDARAQPAYEGEISMAKRFGHIPEAINIPSYHNFGTVDQSLSSLQSIEELKSVYSGIPKSKKVIIYCAMGLVSSSNYFALRELGHDVSNYDASWLEWGNDFKLPIKTAAK